MTVTQAELLERFDYDRETGKFYWKNPAPNHPQRLNGEAGSIVMQHGKPRCSLWLGKKRIYRSRAAFIYVHGDIPKSALVDHINGDTTDDRISNLRIASSVQNIWNRVRKGKNLKGTQKDKRGRWKARIQPPGTTQKINLGTWETEEEAHAAYMGAAAVMHGDFWVGNRPEMQRCVTGDRKNK